MSKRNMKSGKKTLSAKRISLPNDKYSKANSFPVVAIGSSAGGLEAALELFKNLSPTTGMAYIYVQHISPDHKSMLTPILSKMTAMKVQEVGNMEHISPNNVYVIPSDKGIEVTDGHIKVIPRSEGGIAVSIDVLFSSLAETHQENVIGIVLSGNAHDGTKGLKAIKNAGGVTFAQDESAQAKSMPKSAIESGVVDFILSPKKIALKLNLLGKNGKLSLTLKTSMKQFIREEKRENNVRDNDPDLKIIIATLHKRINVDFNLYKLATIKRRINHRMLQCGLKTIGEYSKYLLKRNKEADLLYKDLLINITNFFRDPKAFQYLKTAFLPGLLKSKTQNEPIRIWVPACSTGEEAYSLAMLIAELQANKVKKIPVQIFATDLSDQAIKDARIGEYSEKDLISVGKRRSDRFFTKTGNSYRIAKELRDMCVFAPHNILHDPPFSRLDFISCRNLLIYFDAAAQKKALATMNFALKEGGCLLLGKSESVGTASPFFSQVNGTFKLYCRKKSTGTRKVPDLYPRPSGKQVVEKKIKPLSEKRQVITSSELDRSIDSTLFSLYMPACVIINKGMEIIKFRGSTSLYLSHPPGNASLNILKMTRPEFVFELRNAIQEVIKTNGPVFKPGIRLNTDVKNTFLQMVSLEVRPLGIEWDEPLYLIVFTMQELEEFSKKNSTKNSSQKTSRIEKQIQELHRASSEMTAVIESQDRAFEDLQAANEEIVSASEEFQTLNEELETSKEEIEATNEELLTTNQELQMRNEQLAESYNFSEAVAETMHEPMLILDKHLRVKSANKAFYKKFHLMQGGTAGVLLYELSNHQWDIPDLRQLLDNIIQKNTHFYEHEITYTFPDAGKKLMLLNARPIIQKTQNELLILLTFTDTTSIIKKHKSDNKELEQIINERTLALEESSKTVNQKNVFLEKVNKELETFTFISSHDLQEPLRKIKMFTTSLLENESKNLSASGKGDLDKVQKTATRMQALIDDLLIYAGIKEGKHEYEKINLSKIVKEVADDFKDIIKDKKAIITVDGLCNTKVIVFQFRQVIHNLIGNALKFTHAKRFPRITIKCEVTPGRLLKSGSLLPEVNYCHLAITDNGIGFDQKYQDRIFEVFQRLNGQQLYKGTGMGLAICKRIVENHKGIITSTGRINKGATFDIYLPTL